MSPISSILYCWTTQNPQLLSKPWQHMVPSSWYQQLCSPIHTLDINHNVLLCTLVLPTFMLSYTYSCYQQQYVPQYTLVISTDMFSYAHPTILTSMIISVLITPTHDRNQRMSTPAPIATTLCKGGPWTTHHDNNTRPRYLQLEHLGNGRPFEPIRGSARPGRNL